MPADRHDPRDDPGTFWTFAFYVYAWISQLTSLRRTLQYSASAPLPSLRTSGRPLPYAPEAGPLGCSGHGAADPAPPHQEKPRLPVGGRLQTTGLGSGALDASASAGRRNDGGFRAVRRM